MEEHAQSAPQVISAVLKNKEKNKTLMKIV